jgi:NAD(P)-dependent dehydrogenase (short-subunit alcohol dehydrogenase family)
MCRQSLEISRVRRQHSRPWFSARHNDGVNRRSFARACSEERSTSRNGRREFLQEVTAMSYSIDLSGRTALVTGASSGLGAQFAKTLSTAGATVVLGGRRVERLQSLRAEIEGKGGRAHTVAMDVTKVDSIRAAVIQIETEAGPLDILVNNSGVGSSQQIVDVTVEDYDLVFDTNTKGAFFVAQEVGKRMIVRSKAAASGTFKGARIVNVASTAALKVLGQIGVYAMSKAALVHMTRGMALEWGRFGINVNALCPGYIDTEINHDYWGTDGGQKLVNMLPRRRVGQPHDLDAALIMLCSNEAHFINGAVLAADDGFSI